ncbi:hypothetical protein F4779DRAFT_617977 [Xylariaceae sp. FL0662B]|nr:hypothetical protein F4779DRAFT_617977 [Xylariaceae sp. FL0662B]
MATGNASNGTRHPIRTSPLTGIQNIVLKSFRLDGRTIILTGGTGSIGSEMCKGLAEAGANLAIW